MKFNFHYYVDYSMVEDAFSSGKGDCSLERKVSVDESELSAQARKNLLSLSFSGELIEYDHPMDQIQLWDDDFDLNGTIEFPRKVLWRP